MATEIKDNKMFANKNIVKVTTEEKLSSKNSSLAISFKRSHTLKEKENIYHHIGVYAYNVRTLQKFVNLNQTKNEIKNKLEQLKSIR